MLFPFFVMTLVMACRIVTPARSISFRDRPDVTHTLSAGWGRHAGAAPAAARPGAPSVLSIGDVLSRVIRTPFASD